MPPPSAPRKLSCGVLVTDGTSLLLGHATRSTRWDIPKGLAEPGEAPLDAALRELREETGLVAGRDALLDLGTHAYLRDKDLALFAWTPHPLPDPATLRCTAMVTQKGGPGFPELDRFELATFAAAADRVGRNLARLLALLQPRLRTAAMPPDC